MHFVTCPIERDAYAAWLSTQDAHAPVLSRELRKDVGCRVAGAVVDDNQLEVFEGL